MCLDGGWHQITYEEIKDAARWVEQREDPSLSNDPFIRDNAVPTLQDDGHWDHNGPPWCNQGHPQYGAYVHLANNSQPMARAVNVEEPRVKDYHDGVDNCELEGGGVDMGFDPSDYEGMEELPSVASTSSLLLPHVKATHIAYHYEQQEQWCYTCDETGHFAHNCPVWLQALKDKKGLNAKWALSTGGWKPQNQPKRATKGTPPTKMCGSAHMVRKPDPCAEWGCFVPLAGEG